MSSCMFSDIFYAVRYRMYELPKSAQSHILPREAQSLSKFVHCFGGWIFVCCLVGDNSVIIQMVSRGFTSREFAGRSSFGIKLANPSDTMLAWSVHCLFLFKAFQLFSVTYTHTVVLETLIDNVKWKFFTFLFCGIVTPILRAFSIIFLTHFVKKRPSTPWFVF